MNSHLRNDLEKLKERVLKVAIAVEESVRKSVKAICELSDPLAEEVIVSDIDIDKMEVDTEEECLKILALHQPVASDLRFVVTVLKINSELEHIADMAANMANRIKYIKAEPRIDIPFDLEKVSSRTIYMLKSALDAFLTQDEQLAIYVCEDDEIIDEEYRKCYGNIEVGIANQSNTAMAHINYLLVAKNFERIADLCTNIAEDVIYMKHSIIARHNLKSAADTINNMSRE